LASGQADGAQATPRAVVDAHRTPAPPFIILAPRRPQSFDRRVESSPAAGQAMPTLMFGEFGAVIRVPVNGDAMPCSGPV
jgi:hypothetical protein